MIIRKKSLLNNIQPGLLSVDENNSVIDPAPEDIVQEATNEVNQNVFDSISSELQALEELEEVRNQLSEQVAQNEVNLAAVQGEETPVVGSEFEVTNTEGEVIDTVPAPEAELQSDATQEEIVNKTLDVEAAIECFSGMLTKCRANSENGVFNALGIRRTTIGLESINSNPLAAYKEACEGLKDILSKLGSVMRKAAYKVLDLLSNAKTALFNVFTDYKYILRKVQELNPADYRIKEGGKGKLSGSVVMVLANNGRNVVANAMKSYKTVVDGYIRFCSSLKNAPLGEEGYAKTIKNEMIKQGLIDKSTITNDDVVLPDDIGKVVVVSKTGYRARIVKLNDDVDVKHLLPSTVEGRLDLCKTAAQDALAQYDKVIDLAWYIHDNIEDFLEKYKSIRPTGSATGVGVSVETKYRVPVGKDHDKYELYNNIFDGYTKLSRGLCDSYTYVPKVIKQILATLEKNRD